MSDLWGSQKASSANPIGEHGAWFSQDKYALFIHWGLFSHTEGKWDGQNYFGIVEWLMHPAMANIPPEKYHAISQKFKPDSFNAQAWVDFAKRIGVKTIVITAKHHDGFAMYKSKADSFNVVDATPFKRDPIEELSETCAKAGIRFGFYYSQYQDWREQGGANIDWSDPKQKNSFDAYFKRKALPQVRELLTNYGDIAIAWFDTPGPMDKGYSAQLVDLVRKLQPKALINSRIGNDLGDYATLGDNQVPRVKHGGLWETVDTTNNSWGYTALDSSWKTPSELARRLISTVARGGSYMINMGPHADGTFPEIPDLSLRKVGAWLQRHGESIYGAQASPWSSAQPWGDVTVGKRGLYLHIFDWPDDASRSISLYGIGGKVRAAKLLDDDMPLSVASENGWTTVTLPERKPDSIVPVILLEMEGDYMARNATGVNPNFAGFECRADNRRAPIRATATQGGSHTGQCRADKAGHHRRNPLFQQWAEFGGRAFGGFGHQWRRILITVVGHKQVGCIERCRCDVVFAQGRRHNSGAHPLAQARNRIEGARREFAQYAHTFADLRAFIEQAVNFGLHRVAFDVQQVGNHAVMPFAQCCVQFAHTVSIASLCGSHDSQQAIGDST